MKTYILFLLVISSLVLGIVNYIQVKNISSTPTVSSYEDLSQTMVDGDSGGGTSKSTAGTMEIAVYMSYLQNHTAKLGLAGNLKNWELANFYSTEILESMDKIVASNVYENGIAISPLMKNFGLKSVYNLQESIEKKDIDSFHSSYELLVANCNNCHTTVGHPYIKIKTPEFNTYSNQNFEP